MHQRKLLLVLLAGSFALNAQAQSPWLLTGNSNATSSSQLGTTNTTPLRLVTNNTVKAYIGANGFFGIGSTNPQQRLHVEGLANVAMFASTSPLGPTSGSGMIGYAKALPTAAGQRLGYFLVGSRGGSESNYNTAGMAGYAAEAWSSSSRPTYLTFETTAPNSTSRTERMRIDENGNIGINQPSSPYTRIGVYNDKTGINVWSDGYTVNGKRIGAYGVYSEADGDDGTGVYGMGYFGTGVYGVGGNIGVFGKPYLDASSTPIGVKGESFYVGVYGKSVVKPLGEQDDTLNHGIGVQGDGGRIGVFGQGDTGVYAKGYYNGVRSIATSTTGKGLFGSGYTGVYGAGAGNGDGVFGYVTTAGAWGLHGTSALSYGVYGSTGSSSSYAGYFAGSVFTTGTYSGSDRRLKKDIVDVTSALDVINRLKPKSYTFRSDGAYQGLMLPPGKHYGLIAQEVEEVLPELVKNTEFDAGKADPENNQSTATKTIAFKALNYTELIPLLIKATQEQDVQNKAKDERIEQLEERLTKLEALLSKNNGSSVALAFLENPVPNPSRGNTTLRYGLPEGNVPARLTLTNAKGQVLKEVSLSNRGAGQVTLNTASLPAGVYTYALLVDGQQVATKQLVIAR